MKIEEGKTYRCENGYIFTVRKNHLLRYKFSSIDSEETEVWTEQGVAYHDDCGYNFIEEVVE